MKYSILIPVFNRPAEVDELLESLANQTFKDFEVLVVEDGSTVPCRDVVTAYEEKLPLRYLLKTNSGPGPTRNYGAEKAEGEYLIILDSDCVLPPSYLSEVDKELKREPVEAFGGPDKANPNFTDTQKAISYAMTSFFTTGGIRGGKKKLDKFYPRSFNMGMRRDVYLKLGGFSTMRFGEDIDLSYRLLEAGYHSRLFPEAWVWHKRRTDLRKFFKQVHCSGIARINLLKRHPGTLKLVHLLPTVFTIGCAVLLIGGIWCPWSLLSLVLFALLIGADATMKERSIKVGTKAIGAAFVQLIGYGSGLIRSWWRRCVMKRDEFDAFKKSFYK